VISVRVRTALAYITFFASAGAIVPYLPLYYRGLGFELGELGGLLALGPFVGLLASPAWGALSDRYRGTPRVLFAASLTSIAGAAMLALSQERIVVFGGAAVLGAGIAGVLPILDARALETAGPNRAGYGPVRAWGSAAYIVGALGTGAAIERWGNASLFAVFEGALIATAVIGLGLRPPAGREGVVIQSSTRPLRDAGRLFGPRGLGAFLLGAFLCWLGMAAVLSFTPLRFEELGAGATIVGLGGAIAAGIEVPIMLRYPRLAARFGAERLLILGAATIGLRAVTAALATTPEVLLAASVFGGIGYALFFVGGVTYVSHRVPPQLAATAQGILQGVSNSMSQVVAAAVGGTIAAAIHIDGLFWVAVVLGFAATLIIAFAVRPSAARPGFPPAAGPPSENVRGHGSVRESSHDAAVAAGR
jgi:PPP family 3-phenylpropionic acid transporter